MSKNIYPATFTANEVIAADVSLTAGQYTLIGEYEVAADELVGLGRGSNGTQGEAIGRLYADFVDNAAADITTGKFRIMLVSSQNIPVGAKPVALDVDLAALRTGATVPSDRYVLPFDGTMLSKDKKFQFFIKNDTSAAITLDASACTVLMDMSRVLY
jgi:hypothetical protein